MKNHEAHLEIQHIECHLKNLVSAEELEAAGADGDRPLHIRVMRLISHLKDHQEQARASLCKVNPIVSRVCQLGTATCTVDHSGEKLEQARAEITRLRCDIDRRDCAYREGNGTKHCPPERPCITCQLESARAEIDQARAIVNELGCSNTTPLVDAVRWLADYAKRCDANASDLFLANFEALKRAQRAESLLTECRAAREQGRQEQPADVAEGSGRKSRAVIRKGL